MRVTIDKRGANRAMRFDTERGAVLATICPTAVAGEAVLAVYDRDFMAALAAGGDRPDEAAVSNRYGVSIMRQVVRAIRAANPDIVAWRYERLTGERERPEKVRA